MPKFLSCYYTLEKNNKQTISLFSGYLVGSLSHFHKRTRFLPESPARKIGISRVIESNGRTKNKKIVAIITNLQSLQQRKYFHFRFQNTNMESHLRTNDSINQTTEMCTPPPHQFRRTETLANESEDSE